MILYSDYNIHLTNNCHGLSVWIEGYLLDHVELVLEVLGGDFPRHAEESALRWLAA